MRKNKLWLLFILVLLFGFITACGAKVVDQENAAGLVADRETEAELKVDTDVETDVATEVDTNADISSSAEAAIPDATEPVISNTTPEIQNDSQNRDSDRDPNPPKQTKTCKISINCATILDNIEKLSNGKEEIVPSDGIILAEKEVELLDGESAFDVLLRATKAEKMHMEHSKTPLYKSAYIEGISNLYEFDCGELSGWMYKVNGIFPSNGSSNYQLQDGDVLIWIYTCDLGRDIGGDWNSQNL